METTNEKIKSLNLCGMHSGKRQLLDALQIVLDALKTADKMKWIPATENNTPEDFQDVLVTIVRYDGSKVVRAAVYRSPNKTFRILENDERWEITDEGVLAWMPKPAPYEEEN